MLKFLENLFTFFGMFIGIFIAYPFFALVPAIFFGVIYYKGKNNVVGVTALLWFLYSIYETLNFLRITCSGECNIRVDLLFISPILMVMTARSLFQTIRGVSLKKLH